MRVPCNVRVDFEPGTSPGGYSATLRLVDDQGTVLHEGEPVAVTAGHSIQFGPMMMNASPEGEFNEHAKKEQAPGQPAGPGRPRPR